MDIERRVEAMAIAMRDAAEKFEMPVALYVEGEAERRWEKASRYNERPDDDPELAELENIRLDTDWALESWKILARAALTACGTVVIGESTAPRR